MFSLRFCPASRSSLRYPVHSALVAELLIFDRGLMAEHAGSGAAAHEWEDASSQTQAAPGEGSPAATPRRMSAASDGAVHGTPQGTPGSAQSAPAAPARRMGGKGKGWTPSMPPPQMPVPPAYTQPYPAMSQLRWEQDVYGHWWYSDGQNWWYGHGGSHRFTAPPAGTIPTTTSSIGASWQYVNPETMRHPSGPKPPREPAHPKKPSKPESQKKSPNKKKPPAKEKKKAPPPPPEEDEDDDDDDDGSEGGSSSSYEEVEYEESEEEDGEFTDDPSVAATPRGTPRAAQTPKAAAKAKQAAKPAAKPRPAAPAKAKAGKARPADPPKDPQPPKAFHRAAKVVKKKPKVEEDQDPPSAPPSGPPSHGGSAAPSDISTVRTESIKELLKGRPGSSGERNRTNLGQVKLEVFKGDRAHYRNWIKTIQAQRQLYQLQDEELAVLMFLSCEGEAREVLNQLEIEDMRSAGGLNRVLRLLEDAYGAKADERFEEKQSEFMSYRRRPERGGLSGHFEEVENRIPQRRPWLSDLRQGIRPEDAVSSRAHSQRTI